MFKYNTQLFSEMQNRAKARLAPAYFPIRMKISSTVQWLRTFLFLCILFYLFFLPLLPSGSGVHSASSIRVNVYRENCLKD
jgi:hypothetical protein